MKKNCFLLFFVVWSLHMHAWADQTFQANGLTFHTDVEKPVLTAGELAVFPYSDEAAILLKMASEIKEKRGKEFVIVVDPFCGDGKSGLPMVSHHIAARLIGSDLNPRAIHYAQVNASHNHLEACSSFGVRDLLKEEFQHSDAPGNTLWIANPPFALKAKGTSLEVMRDGGENGLTLTLAFATQALKAAQPGDVILGIGYSRISSEGSIELEQALLSEIAKHGGTLKLTLLDNQKLWRGFNGKKEQNNPMPISEETFTLKADPANLAEVEAYRTAAQFHRQAGYTQLGYFAYIIEK